MSNRTARGGAGIQPHPSSPYLASGIVHSWGPASQSEQLWSFSSTTDSFSGWQALQARLPRLDDLLPLWTRLDGLIRLTTTASPDQVDTLRRRLNREPGSAVAAVELGAEILTETLSRTDRRAVSLVDVDRTDSLTIRLLARAAVRAGFRDRVRYDWIAAVPSADITEIHSSADLRLSLLARIARAGIFQFQDPVFASPLEPEFQTVEFDESLALRELVAHNYDHAFARAQQGAGGPKSSRIAALALIAGGDFVGAARLMHDALANEHSRLVRAHILCLLGLLESKRFDRLEAADALFQSGLYELSQAPLSDAANVERGWLLNGRALIRALRFRSTRSEIEIVSAYQLCRDALALVGSATDKESSYLRYNLLANTALLHEMRGDFGRALTTMRSTVGVPGLVSKDARALAIYEYRIGLLDLRAGARTWTPGAFDPRSLPIEDWPVADYLLRLTGAWHLQNEDNEAASRAFTAGIQLAERTRSAAAMSFHLEALALSSESAIQAEEVARLIGSLPAKLPTNSTEVDFDFEPTHRVGERLRT